MVEAANCSVIKRSLKSLCVANGFSYGVFWGYDHRNPMLLTVEDSYSEERFKSAIDGLLQKVHLLGEGAIGQAAFTGKHQWMLVNETGLEPNSLSFQYDSEICSQFYSGIKTIVVIPVEPRGVVQFGSTKTISERLEFVDQTVRLFQENNECLGQNPNQFDDISCITTSASFYCTQSQTEAENHFQAFSENHMDFQQTLPSVFDELIGDFKPDIDFGTDLFGLYQADDFSQWFASMPDQTGDLMQLVESASNSSSLVKETDISITENSVVIPSKDVLTNVPSGKRASETNAASVSGARKGLFSELGLEELLSGTISSSCLTGSNFEDQSCSAKRRRIENAGSSCPNSENNPKSQVGLWIDDSYSLPCASVVLSSQPQKSEGQKRVIRKRARPGESTRPRPKDRQLIQDRIKELKGIIPNGARCSIDSLLERTIKYMVFLQGVTKHGDKLKQTNKPKLIGNENGAALREKNSRSSGGGATWAFEVGNPSMVCPIIVEDLSPPGQMLIEMLCEEQGFFLEIADIIRGFGLSILKGVMEVREGKIWAHFIVEAKSNVTRIEVFWSLMRLLQQTSADPIDSINPPSNALLNGLVPPMGGFPKPKLLPPICLAETLR